MPTISEKLNVILTANTSRFAKAMKRATAPVRSLGRLVKSASRALMTMQGALIGAAGVAGLGLLARNALRSIDALGKTADKLGTTTEQLQAMRHAAALSGVEIRTLDMALQRMTRRIAEAALNTGEAKQAIKDLGLNAVELAKRGPYAALLQVADAMLRVEDKSQRLRLAFKLFDSEGVALVNTLSRGSAGIKEAYAELDRFGALLSRIEVKQVERVNDAFTRMGVVLGAVRDRIAVKFAPLVELLIGKFLDWASTGTPLADRIGHAIDVIAKGIQSIIEFVAKAVTVIVRGIEKVVNAFPGVSVSFGVELLNMDMALNRFLAKLDRDIAALRDKAGDMLGATGGGAPLLFNTDAVDTATKSIGTYIKSLREQVDTYGMASRWARFYLLDQKGLTIEQFKAIDVSTRRLDLLDREVALTKQMETLAGQIADRRMPTPAKLRAPQALIAGGAAEISARIRFKMGADSTDIWKRSLQEQEEQNENLRDVKRELELIRRQMEPVERGIV